MEPYLNKFLSRCRRQWERTERSLPVFSTESARPPFFVAFETDRCDETLRRRRPTEPRRRPLDAMRRRAADRSEPSRLVSAPRSAFLGLGRTASTLGSGRATRRGFPLGMVRASSQDAHLATTKAATVVAATAVAIHRRSTTDDDGLGSCASIGRPEADPRPIVCSRASGVR